MTVLFFGDRWDAPNIDGATQVDTPVGERCRLCQRPIEAGDQGFIRAGFTTTGPTAVPTHRGCEMGSVAGHVFGVCSCTGWDDMYERGIELIRRLDTGELTT